MLLAFFGIGTLMGAFTFLILASLALGQFPRQPR